MMTRDDARKMQVAHDSIKYRGLIDMAEQLAEERPAWMVRKLKKIDGLIKKRIKSGGGSLFILPGWLTVAFRTVNRVALGIALCEMGYYVSVDSSFYVSWDWHHRGILKCGSTLERYQGGEWNVDKQNLSGLYKSLAQKQDDN